MLTFQRTLNTLYIDNGAFSDQLSNKLFFYFNTGNTLYRTELLQPIKSVLRNYISIND